MNIRDWDIGSFWLIGCVLFSLGTPARAEPGERIVPFEVWRDSVRGLDNLKASYKIDSHPTQKILTDIRTNPPAENLRPKVIDIFSQYHTLIDITRKGDQWRYETKREVSPIDVDSITKGKGAFGQSKVVTNEVESHSAAGFFYLDKLENSGAFRAEWPMSPETPLSFVLTPEVTNLVMQLKDSGTLIELKDKSGKSLTRYHLDSRFAMMPTEIEYFDVQKNGSLFLYRVIKVENYLQTKQGAFIPESGVIYDYASKEGEHLTWQVEQEFKLIKSEIGIDIPDSEFEIKFPPGTHVTDYTIDVEYIIPKDGRNPNFSIANSESDGRVIPPK
jgi:hypothetical protein